MDDFTEEAVQADMEEQNAEGPSGVVGSSRREGERCQKLKLRHPQTIALATIGYNAKNFAGNIAREPEMSRLFAYVPHRWEHSIHLSSSPRRPSVGSNGYICHGADQGRRPLFVFRWRLRPDIFQQTKRME